MGKGKKEYHPFSDAEETGEQDMSTENENQLFENEDKGDNMSTTAPVKESIVTPKEVPPTPVKNTRVEKFVKMLTKYKEVVKVNRKVQNSTLCVDAFDELALFVVKSKEYEIFDLFYKFMAEELAKPERQSACATTVALKGIGRLKDANKKVRVGLVYTLFSNFIEMKTKHLPFRFSIEAVRSGLKNEDLCNWLVIRRRTH